MADDATTILKRRYERLGTWRAVADSVGDVSPALCWRVARGECESPRIDRALGLGRDRCRISADVSPAQRDALHELAAPYGGWSAFCRRLAESSEAECLLRRTM